MNWDAGRMWWGRGGVVALVVGAWVLSGVPWMGAEASAAAPGDPVCTIRGTARAELLRGTAGADVICGLGGDDQLLGLGGNDALFGGGGDDVVVGGAGNDLLRGAAGNDVEFGGGGNDRLRNWAGADRLSGGAGNDHLRGGQGADVVSGGSGRDVATYAGHTAGVRASIGTGADDGRPGEGDNIGADVEDLRGGPGNDTLIGSAGANQLFGTAGNDRVTGLAGSDLLDGGGGRDVLNALDGFVDVLSCGGGAGDRAIADMTDRVGAGCETVVQNDAPVAVDDQVTAVEDTVLVLPVTGAGSPAANDTDVDGDTLTVTAVSGATGGSVAIVAGMIRFAPAAELCGAGVAGFDYRVSDGGGGTDVGEVTVTVTCVDDPPTAVNDTATVLEDDPATTIDVLANDTDIDDGPITVDDATQPTNGTVVVAAGGADLTYQPDANYCNTQTGGSPDTFTYTLNGGDTATVTVTVTCVPDTPVAIDDTATVAEASGATTIDVLANDDDPDPVGITIDSATQPANGTVVVAVDGADLTYDPDPNYCNTQTGGSPDTFTYTLTPGGSTATVSVTVTCFDDPPTAVNDTATVTEDDPATPIDVLANDTDIDDGPITVDDATQPTNGTVVVAVDGAALTYQPDANYCNTPTGGSPDTFTYTLAPGGSTATVSVTVTCVPDTPAANDDTATVAEDTAATTIDVLANDDDPDPVGITIDDATQPANGTVTVAADGADLTYQPDPNYCNTQTGGSPDTFTYTLTPGGSTAIVSVTVTCVPDTPVAIDDTATVAEDSDPTTIDVLANDDDPDPVGITIDDATQPDNGTVVAPGGADLTYQPDPNYCNTQTGGSPDTFTYTLTPGGSTATVSVTVTCVDDAPLAVNDTATVTEDDPATTIDVLANDTDIDDGPITVDQVTQPTNGTVVITNSGDDLSYQPDPNYCNTQAGGSPDTFTYTLAPGGSTATVAVTVTCVAEDPVAVDDQETVAEDSGATTIDVLANDVDADSVGLTIDDATQPANGIVVVAADGADLTYQPDPDYCNTQAGGSPDTFTYTLTPGGSTATVSVTVTCVDDAPTAVNDTATVTEDGPATTFDVLGNDLDIDDGPISIDQVTQPANGTVVVAAGGDDLTYQPNANYCNTQPGGSPDTFTYTLTPGGSTATVSVTVTCVDDPPVAVNDAATVTEDDLATAIAVLANDVDPDGGTITIVSASEPANGTVVLTGGSPGARTGLTYQPDLNYCNTQPGGSPDTFTYTVNGGDDATVSVTVTCVDDPPVAVNDTATVAEDTAATAVDVLANDTDVDGGPKAITAITQPTNGTVVTTGGGAGLTYEPDANYCNSQAGGTPDTFTYTITGGSTATVAVTVTCVDDPPVAVNDTATVLEDAAATALTVLANDTDIDAGPTTITTVTQPGNGTVVITGGGTGLTYQPAPNYCNNPPGTTPDTFTYTLNGGSTATVSVSVTCVNDPPVAGDDSFTGVNAALANTRLVVGTTSTGPNLTVAGSVLSDDTDIDSPASGFTAGPATISSANCAGCNNVTMEADGNFIYDPPAGFTGNDTFTYTVNDNDPDTPANQTDTATVTIAVVGPLVWYVDIDAAAPPAGQGGRSHSPFNSLAPLTTGGTADTLDGTGDIIFVGVDNAPATGPYEGGIVLEANQKLWGEPFGLNVDPTGARPSTQLVAATPATPVANNPNVRNTGSVGITLANGVDIQRVNAGITGASGTTGISGTSTTTATIGPNQLIHGNTTGIVLTGAAGGDITIGAAIFAPTGSVVRVENRSSGTVTFNGDITSTDGNGGVFLNGNTGAAIAFTGAINLAGTGPAGTTFTATGGGTITANNAANQITGFTGTTAGVNLNGVAIGTAGITFNNLTSAAAGVANGILLTNVAGTGAFTVNGGAITATTRGLDIDGGAGNVTVNASLTTSGTTARSVEVTNRTGGTVDINGLVTESSTGINLSTNGTGLVRFDGGINANTGTNPAFASAVSGNLAITDANGATAPNNAITTTTGTALNVANTTIHTDGLTFLSINASGATNGIVLNNTGAGGLTVTGTGTTPGSGGTIQNTSNRGASFISASNVSLSSMNFTNAGTTDLDADNSGLSTGDNLATNAAIHLQTVSGVTLTRIAISGGAEQGINGNTVSNFVLTGSSITNAGNEPDEDGIHFFNMTGTSSIANTTITSTVATPNTTGGDDHLNLQTQSGTLNLTISGGSATNANKGSGYLFGIRGSTNATIQFQNATSTGNFSGGIVADVFDSATMSLTVSNSTSSGNNDQLSVSAGDNSNVDLNANGNTLSSVATADFVVVSLLGSAFDTGYTFDARIQNNTISVANGLNADGISVFNAGGSNLNLVISGNTFTYAGTQRAINIQGGQDGPSNLDATVTGNNIDIQLDGTGNAVTGILAQAQVADPSGAGSSLCANIGGAGTLANTFTHSLGGTMAGGDIRVRQRFGSTIQLPGYAGGATDTAAVIAYLDGRNNEVSPSTATVDAGSFSGPAACTEPNP